VITGETAKAPFVLQSNSCEIARAVFVAWRGNWQQRIREEQRTQTSSTWPSTRQLLSHKKPKTNSWDKIYEAWSIAISSSPDWEIRVLVGYLGRWNRMELPTARRNWWYSLKGAVLSPATEEHEPYFHLFKIMRVITDHSE